MKTLTEIKVTEISMDEGCFSVKTTCDQEEHVWITQTADGKFKTELGCLEFCDSYEFDEDDFSENLKRHYETSNIAFDENVERLHDEESDEILEKRDSYFYAECIGQHVTENIYEGGFLRYEKDSQPYCDLWRFDNEEERDSFVNEEEHRTSISTEDAVKTHKDQFNYWKN